MSKWHKNDSLAAIAREAALFRQAIVPTEYRRRVPSCPEWTLRDLLVHLGAIYRWLAGSATAGNVRPQYRWPDYLPGPEVDPVAFFDVGYAEVTKVLEAADADTPMWNWAPRPKTARFWWRRIACETAVHRWDAQMAIGAAEPLAVDLARECVDEVFDSFLPAGRRHITEATGLVQVIAKDAKTQWYVRLRGPSIALLDTSSVEGSHPLGARITGSASDLALALWGRVPFRISEVAGDEQLLAALRVNSNVAV